MPNLDASSHDHFPASWANRSITSNPGPTIFTPPDSFANIWTHDIPHHVAESTVSASSSSPTWPGDSFPQTSTSQDSGIGIMAIPRADSSFSTLSKSPTACGKRPRVPRGRTGPLNPKARQDAAFMRRFKACDSCRKRKAKCDAGIPCKSCVLSFGANLLLQPCRGKVLASLAIVLLSAAKIFPAHRPISSFLGLTPYTLQPSTHTIQLNFGFGPSIPRRITLIAPADSKKLIHDHTIYTWPPPPHRTTPHTRAAHYVFPAILSETADLPQVLSNHLSVLVDAHFRHFPLFSSRLHILRDIYIFYRRLPPATPMRELLHKSLKLLVLVHVGGDVTLVPSDPVAMGLAKKFFPLLEGVLESPTSDCGEDGAGGGGWSGAPLCTPREPTPCFIRGQLGAVMPGVAEGLMREVLEGVERASLGRACGGWVGVLAVFCVVLMCIETGEYHGAKRGYHETLDHRNEGENGNGDTEKGKGRQLENEQEYHGWSEGEKDGQRSEGVEALLGFYRTCYSGCHGQLKVEDDGVTTTTSSSSLSSPNSSWKASGGWKYKNAVDPGLEDASKQFLASLKTSMADAKGYLKERKEEAPGKGDMSGFFDRLLAKLLLLDL
ncbi:hypothetical protein K402DRAFT_412005 [Aulographum hederae CBS 113979]|uniref:Zn(2)-C6 fungal-type domain-containing protein n=1 Tax=Aulographum hederae CBS 113979 TaxID=1176131 RepID=A0A6G1H3W9_9PEZI|nr:hypothetical protein K402DRAFT_412005 [Aulographum hederae CBS 113979]